MEGQLSGSLYWLHCNEAVTILLKKDLYPQHDGVWIPRLADIKDQCR